MEVRPVRQCLRHGSDRDDNHRHLQPENAVVPTAGPEVPEVHKEIQTKDLRKQFEIVKRKAEFHGMEWLAEVLTNYDV